MLQKNGLSQTDALGCLFDDNPDGIGIVDTDGHFVYANESVLTKFGRSRNELREMTLDRLLEGSVVKMTSIPIVNGGQETGKLIRVEEVARRQEQGKELSDVYDMFSFLSEKSQNIISSISADGVFRYISPTVKALLGYEPEEVLGKPASSFNHPDTNKKLQEHRSSLFIDQNTVRFTGRVRHKNGEYRWYETTAEYIRDEAGQIIQTICVGRDITDRKEAEEAIAYLAFHDSLTDLANRRLFRERVNKLLEEGEAARKHHALMLIDLDGFKQVNDTFGHDRGDLLLVEVADRLKNAVGDKGLVARWGGDEFIVLQTDIQNKTDMASLIKRIKAAISEPVSVEEHTHFISASVGVSYFLEDGESLELLIRNADAAMYRAKRQTKKSLEDE